MPHNRFDWASRIKTAEREYHAVRVAVDWLLGATPDEIHDVTKKGAGTTWLSRMSMRPTGTLMRPI